MWFPDIFIRKSNQLIMVNRLVSQIDLVVDLVGTSSGPSNIKTTSEEGSMLPSCSEHFPPLTTNSICHTTPP